MSKFVPALALAGILAAGVASLPARSADAPKGSFSEAQAKRGATLFSANCAMCHGEKLDGVSAPQLAGKEFLTKWSGQTAADLYDLMSTQMPLTAPGSLKPDEYLAILAFVLKSNGYAAGSAALDAGHLKGVKIVKPAN